MKNLKFILFAIVHLVFLAHSARAYYDPATGQFLSREPLGENESLNLYTYGYNDPVNNVDVLGLQAVSVTSQEMSDTLRSRWLLELVASGLQHPESPTANQTRTYANYFGLTKPFTDADYDRAASLAGGLMVNHGRPSARTPSWEETELAKQPGMMPYVAPPAVQTAALSIGAPSSSAFYADMNAAFLLPIVHIASPQALIGVTVGPGNVLAAIEREVAVELLPTQFAARSQTITAAQSRSILEGMGIRTPATIADKAALDAALRASTPMTPAQIHAYLKAAGP